MYANKVISINDVSKECKEPLGRICINTTAYRPNYSTVSTDNNECFQQWHNAFSVANNRSDGAAIC